MLSDLHVSVSGGADMLFPASRAAFLRGKSVQQLRLLSATAATLLQRSCQRFCQHQERYTQMCELAVQQKNVLSLKTTIRRINNCALFCSALPLWRGNTENS